MLKWRLRSSRNLGTRFLHLLDSQVTIAVSSKKRSSSVMLNHVVRKSACLEIAGDIAPAYGFVRSENNPADEPSRAKRRKK